MAAISSLQRIGWPASASTRAAASRALRRLLAASAAGSSARVFSVLGALAILADAHRGGCFFLVAMMLSSRRQLAEPGTATAAVAERSAQLPRGSGSDPDGAARQAHCPVPSVVQRRR